MDSNPYDGHIAPSRSGPSESRKRLTLRPPKDYQVGLRMDKMREAIIMLGEIIENETPAGREQSLALTNLEQVCFWAIGAIARNQGDA